MARKTPTPESEVEEMRRLLAKSGWVRYGSIDTWTHYDHKDEHVLAAQSAADKSWREVGAEEARAALADMVIDVYGLRANYPDKTTTKTGTRTVEDPFYRALSYPYSYSYMPRYTYETYEFEETTPGRVKFLADLEAVAAAVKAKGARKRIGL